MVTAGDKNKVQQSWPLWRIIFTGLNTLALVMSIILSWHYLEGGSIVGCGGGSSCEQVLNSRWSTIAGILPVSGLAVGVYLAILVTSFFTGPATEAPIRRLAWGAMLILIGTVAGSAIWFIIIQEWFIGNFCFYCMTTHITGLLLTALAVWRAMKDFYNNSNGILLTNSEASQDVPTVKSRRNFRLLAVTGRLLIGLVLAGILVACQIAFTPPAVYSVGESNDNLHVINHHNVPMIGSPDAPYTVTLLFDYECPHCQKLHFLLDEAVRRYKGKLAFELCPTPLNTKCNPYIPQDVEEFKNSCELAKIGLTVWVAKHNAFPAFDNWMFTFEAGDSWRPRSLESAKAKAVELVGKAKFQAAWVDPWIEQYMQTCIKIFGQTLQNGNGGVPKLIFGSRWVIPEPYNADDLVRILQKSLDVPNP